MNVYFISLVIREVQIKIATRYHFTSVRKAKIKDNNKGVEKFGTLNMMLVGIIKWCCHFGKLYGGVSKNYKQKHYITQQLHSEVYNPCKKKKKKKTLIQKDICTSMSITGLFIIAKVWKQPECTL